MSPPVAPWIGKPASKTSSWMAPCVNSQAAARREFALPPQCFTGSQGPTLGVRDYTQRHTVVFQPCTCEVSPVEFAMWPLLLRPPPGSSPVCVSTPQSSRESGTRRITTGNRVKPSPRDRAMYVGHPAPISRQELDQTAGWIR
ncbi:unnamed protein product [Pleuronectes platessa]|uniref:Uncharacterized protein n=1 Tax=Pleuronectes platessa TaxID=8262 RepID=A0A9N7UDS6_PLEPL|nr:unnamed protein product [Pleuronectes platessa]